MQELNLPKDFRFIDFGCGTGLACELLKHKYGYSKFDGIDASPMMLEKAKEKQVYTSLDCMFLGNGSLPEKFHG